MNDFDRTKVRTFSETHPWISFKADLSRAGFPLWLLLGEAQSKCEHLAGVPLRPDFAEELYKIYLSKGIHATTSIEGNTLSEAEVYKRIEGKLPLPRSREYLGREVDNIVKACDEVVTDLVKNPEIPLTRARILSFNAMALEGLEVEEGVVPGECRTYSVGVAGYRAAPAEDCAYLLDRLCEWLEGLEFRPPNPDLAFTYLFLKAVLAHLYIAWIHPFGDGNGRTARLVEFQILAQSGVPLPAAHLLSNFYNQTRARYYQELDRASRSGGEILPFVQYAAEGFVDGLREQLATVLKQQWTVTWENFVHDQFDGQDGPAQTRRRHLVLDLPTDAWVPRDEIDSLTPRLASDYAKKSEKTLARDLKDLVEAKLIAEHEDSYRAAAERILPFQTPKITREFVQKMGRVNREARQSKRNR